MGLWDWDVCYATQLLKAQALERKRLTQLERTKAIIKALKDNAYGERKRLGLKLVRVFFASLFCIAWSPYDGRGLIQRAATRPDPPHRSRLRLGVGG